MMLVKFARYLCGSVGVRVTGEHRVRFLNLAVKSGINFWDYDAGEDSFTFRVNLYRISELRRLSAKTGAEVEFFDRRGLPLRVEFIAKRPGLVFGLVLATWTIVSLSDNIWVLRTSGSAVYSQEEIFAAAKELGIELGADYDDFDPISAGRMMMLSLPDISWVSINNDGVFTEILVKDRVAPPQMEEKVEGIWNVVASRPGVIYSVEAKEGMPQVVKGDIVNPGDMCISGIWEDKYGRSHTAPSYGKVYAQVQENFTVTVPDTRTIYRKGKTAIKRHLEIFGLKIPLSLTHAGFESSSSERKEQPLTLLGVELPIKYSATAITELLEERELLPESDMEALALAELQKQQAAFPGELLWQENEISFSGGCCTLKSRSFFLMDIGVRREVLVDESILANQYKSG